MITDFESKTITQYSDHEAAEDLVEQIAMRLSKKVGREFTVNY